MFKNLPFIHNGLHFEAKRTIFLVIKFQFLMNLMYPSKVGSTIQMYKKFIKSHGSWSKWQPKKKRLQYRFEKASAVNSFGNMPTFFPIRKCLTKKKFFFGFTNPFLYHIKLNDIKCHFYCTDVFLTYPQHLRGISLFKYHQLVFKNQ